MTPSRDHAADLLLEHRGFLTGLARSLLMDEQHAEDVVQEAYLAALHRPPPAHVGLRAWLTGVTRNLALRRRRTEGRRRRHEPSAAQSDRLPATVDVAARVEAQRWIADAVASLDEPGRSAIVWRYFDGLPPREIARREGVSVRTIESRLRRAREALRGRLDGHFGGDRRAWCAVLLPIVGTDLPTHLSTSAAAAAAASPATGTASAATVVAAASAGATFVSTKLILGAAAVCVGAAFYVGRETAPSNATLTADTETVSSASDDTGPTLAGADTAAVLAARDQTIVELRAELDQVTKQNANLKAELAAAADAHAAAHKQPAKTQIADRFAGDRYKKVVGAVEWSEAGEAAAKMLPLLGDLVDAMTTGKDIDDNVGIEIFQHNQKLQKVAIAAATNDLPGTGGNGAFTHPVVVLNLIASTLEQGKQPLDETQTEKLYEIGDRFVAEDDRRRSGYTEQTLKIQRTLEECDLKDRMFAEVDGILTEAQRNLLHPESVRGRLGVDIFSSGVIYYTIGKPVDFSTREDLAENLVAQYRTKASLTDAEMVALQAAAKEWADGFQETTLEASGDKLSRDSRAQSGGILTGWIPVTHAREAAVRQLELNKVLLELVAGDVEKTKAVLNDGTIYIPAKRP